MSTASDILPPQCVGVGGGSMSLYQRPKSLFIFARVFLTLAAGIIYYQETVRNSFWRLCFAYRPHEMDGVL